MKPKPTIGSLFAGIGGLDLAAQWAGFETAWFVEKEPFPQQVLRKHWPDVPIYDDVFECHDLPYVDVIVGGFPCQPFSVAGKRQGANDERFLLPEMLRIIREVQPYAVLFENVPGFPSLNDGAEFKYLLRALAEMGFNAEWGHLRASDCGAPHQRERWFCVAYAGQRGLQGAGISSRNEWRTQFNVRNGGKVTMAYTASLRRDRHQPFAGSISAGERAGRLLQPKGSGSQLGNANGRRRKQRHAGKRAVQKSNAGYSNVVNASSTGRKKWHVAPVPGGTGYVTGRHNTVGRQWQLKSLMGRDSHGLPGGLDFVGWPARPGEAQHEWEPPRVTSGRTPNRAARLKALGNAVVPQVAFPLFMAIREWLDEQAEIEAAS
jgi:DNA (cytosine-5)-methyltransferase 1